jgi:hypothetical protein
MQRVSSQLTIMIRIFIPTVWFTFVLSVCILLFWSIRGKAGLFSNPFIWVALFIILGTGFFFIRFLLWKLYRVDMDNQFIYISNYFKTYKYRFEDIESIRDTKIGTNRIYVIELKSKGSFGKKIHFLASQVLWNDFIKNHPGQLGPLLAPSPSAN